MKRNRKQPKATLMSSNCLGFKSVVETRNVLDCNSVDLTKEKNFCANDYFGFRFLNNQIVYEIGLRPSKENIINWLKEREFFFIDFNLMCILERKSRRFYYPVELGLVKYSMMNGIVEEYHTFIDCGKIPDGCAGQACQYENEHRIPLFDTSALRKLCFDTVETIIDKLHQIITKDTKILTKDKKFVCFNVPEKITQTFGGYEWLDLNNDTNIRLPECSVLSLYDLTCEISKFMEIKDFTNLTTVSKEFNDSLNKFDNELFCCHHQETYCNNCAIANCRRLAAAFSSLMSHCFDIKPFNQTKMVSNSKANSVKCSIEEEDQAIVKVLKAAPDNINNAGSQRQRIPATQSLPPGFEKVWRQRSNGETQMNVRKEGRLENGIKDDRRANYVKDERKNYANVKSVHSGYSKSPQLSSNATNYERRPETNFKYKTQIYSRKSHKQFNDKNYERVENNRRRIPPRFSRNSHQEPNFQTGHRQSDKNVEYTPSEFSRISNRRTNVTKDERRFETNVKTVPPESKGSTKRKVNIDSVNDALRNTHI